MYINNKSPTKDEFKNYLINNHSQEPNGGCYSNYLENDDIYKIIFYSRFDLISSFMELNQNFLKSQFLFEAVRQGKLKIFKQLYFYQRKHFPKQMQEFRTKRYKLANNESYNLVEIAFMVNSPNLLSFLLKDYFYHRPEVITKLAIQNKTFTCMRRICKVKPEAMKEELEKLKLEGEEEQTRQVCLSIVNKYIVNNKEQEQLQVLLSNKDIVKIVSKTLFKSF